MAQSKYLIFPLKMVDLSIAMLVYQRLNIPLNPIKSHKTTIFLWFSYGFPMVFLWFTNR